MVPERVDGRLSPPEVRLIDDVIVDERRRMNHFSDHRHLLLLRKNQTFAGQQVAVDCSRHEDGHHGPERLPLAVEVVGGDAAQLGLRRVEIQLPPYVAVYVFEVILQ